MMKFNPLSKVFVPRAVAPEHEKFEISENVEQRQFPKSLPKLFSDRQLRELNEKGDIAALIDYYHNNTPSRFKAATTEGRSFPVTTQDQFMRIKVKMEAATMITATTAMNKRRKKASVKRYQTHRSWGKQPKQLIEAATGTSLTESMKDGYGRGQKMQPLSPGSADSACSMGYDSSNDPLVELESDTEEEEEEIQGYAAKMERWMDLSDDEFVPGGL